jgi:type VI protein secretion system component VasK
MGRAQFVWQAFWTGARWVHGWLSWVQSAVLLLAVVGVAALGGVNKLPGWAVVLIIALLVLITFAEGAYRLWRQEVANRPVPSQDQLQQPVVRGPSERAPMMAPVDYQVKAVLQCIDKLRETLTEFDFLALDSVLGSLPRRGMDRVYDLFKPSQLTTGAGNSCVVG